MKDLIRNIGALEWILIGTWSLYSLTTLILWDQFWDPGSTLMLVLSVLIGTVAIAGVAQGQRQVIVDFSRACIAFLTCLASYEFVRMVIDALPRRSYELTMLRLDLALFGGNPSEWMQHIHHPILTEYFQIVYIAYMPILFSAGLTLLVVHKSDIFNDFAVSLMLSVVFGHILYVLVPVRSPFIVADYLPYSGWVHYQTDLVGLHFAAGLRAGLLDATTMRHDCFPSGHTMHTLIASYFAIRGHKAVGGVIAFVAFSLIASTLYLRYHYGVDLIAGATGALLFIWMGPKLRAFVQGKQAPVA